MGLENLADLGLDRNWVESASGSVADSVPHAVVGRHSVRAFLPKAIEKSVIDELLTIAHLAPSGSNLQPWKVHVMFAKKLRELGNDMQQTYLAKEPGHKREYNYYEISWVDFEPYATRRQKCGWGLYNALQIARHEKERLAKQRSMNFNFFYAPVAFLFTIDRRLELGSWIDYGIFLQSLNLMARARGLHTCTMASVSEFPKVVRRNLPIGEDEIVMCGMALGYKDETAQINSFRLGRAPLSEFAKFYD
jgi:nitroreductase